MKNTIVFGSVVFACFVSFAGLIQAGDCTVTLDDNAGSSSFVVQDSDKTNQFKANSDGQGYFGGNVGIGTTVPGTFGYGSTVLEVKNKSNQAEVAVVTENTGTVANLILGHSSTHFARMNFDGSTGSNPGLLYFGFGSGVSSPKVRFDVGSTNTLFMSGGNVGIGTTNPSSKLTVAGTIESTSGGVKFPDGTTQTTAAGSTSALKTYDSGWFAVSANSSYSKTHNLGTTKVLITIMISENSDGSGRCTLAYSFDYSVQGQCVMESLSTATVSIRTYNTVVDMQNASGRWYSTSGYARIIMLALE